ncbi:hypothetical protein [Streptomyces sp. NPDC007088]|uniref:hypothetical protein n=1 Tax=Streptomyces sp. NPDC007088 TaxID=3364773 RepID=UPI0036BB876F
MIVETLGSVAVGLALAWLALHRLAHRLPHRSLVLSTGGVGGAFGAFVTHTSLGPGHVTLTLLGAVAFTAALLSLLLRPARRRRPHPRSASAA